MKIFLLVFVLSSQIHLSAEEVINYDKEYQRQIDSLKKQLDALIKLRNLEMDDLESQIEKLKLKNQGNRNQYEKENIELQKQLNACKLEQLGQEKKVNELKNKLLDCELKNKRTNDSNELLKEQNLALQMKIKQLEERENKLKGLVRKLSDYARRKKAKERKIYQQYQDLQKDIASSIKPEEGRATIHKNADHTRLIINLSEAVSFNSGSAVIKKKAKPLLDSIFKIITKYPDYHIFIEGHTDNVPIHSARIKNNWELSTKRALNVLGYALKKNPNLDPTRFSASGYGEFHPLDRNTTKEGRKRNRRVDIIVMYR
ncbi:MAG: OmpA family protein [Spirochaetota bacterium]